MKKICFGVQKNVIAQGLKEYRVKRKLSQEQLAAKMQLMGVHMDQQMISKIENNRRIVTDYELACFCAILQVSPQELWADLFGSLIANL